MAMSGYRFPRDVSAQSVDEFLEVLPPIVAKVRDTVRAANASRPAERPCSEVIA